MYEKWSILLKNTNRGTEGEFISLEDGSEAKFLQWQECIFQYLTYSATIFCIE